jgi:hypothetical protein
MTKLWGPLGWMTLHSVSFIYPEKPSVAEKTIAEKFLELFTETISCNACKSHFKTIHLMYKSSNPDYLNSRQNFAIFVFRAHNTVNKRLDKPRPSTVAECLASIKLATTHTSLAQFRQSYLSYLNRNWGIYGSGDGFILRGHVKEMIKINNEYWSPREIPIPELEEANVLAPIEKLNARIAPSGRVSSTNVGFKGGKLRLNR